MGSKIALIITIGVINNNFWIIILIFLSIKKNKKNKMNDYKYNIDNLKKYYQR